MTEFIRGIRMPLMTTCKSFRPTVALQNCFIAADLGVVPAVGHDPSMCSYG